MADLRRTRRVRDPTEALSLEAHITSHRRELVGLRLEAPQLRQRALDMRRRADAMNRRFQRRLRLDLRRAATELENEADVRDSMVREHSFEHTVVAYLRAYHTRSAAAPAPGLSHSMSDTMEATARQRDVARSRAAGIVDEYLTDMCRAPPKVAMAVRDECPHCDNVTLLLCSVKSIMCCTQCGYSVAYLDATSSSTAYDEVIEFSQYSYKRVNHYLMWLALIQGKETHVVPDDILDAVMRELYERRNVRCATDITQKMVRESLRRLRLRRAYDHVAQITARLTGVRPPRISAETEEQLKNMFLQMQPAFHRHAPRSRTNFLSYSYVLYRCFQILGLPHMLEGLTLLKGRDKLEANDAIFRKMCVDLKWPVFDLPPND